MDSTILDYEPISISSPPKPSPKDVCASKDILKGSISTFQSLVVLKQLSKAKFPVYTVVSKVNNRTYAMKVFPYENGQIHPYYWNEIRFSRLSHPNIIDTVYHMDEREAQLNQTLSLISYKVMEYAQYGEFFDFISKNHKIIDDKLVRTYFKQLIEGLEYLHSKGVSHMDLKLDNILIGENYTLKIADFDMSKFATDTQVISGGTKFYRAPEVMLKKSQDTNSADVYSAGVILFAFKSKGILPHAEDTPIDGVDFFGLLNDNDPKFWEEHNKIQCNKKEVFDKDFKELFLSMTRPDVEKRAKISDIKESQWYNGPCYTQEELKAVIKKVL